MISINTIERIKKNEERFNRLLKSVNNLEVAIKEFEEEKKELYLLKKYYGSKNWFKDKEDYENGKYKGINAGVLSEDGVWNLLDNIDDIKKRGIK